MASQPKPPLTAEDYLAMERLAETRSEYLDGEIFAMAGASQAHNRIVLNFGGSLNSQLDGRPCEVFVSDMKVRVAPSGPYTYPDVVVVCGGAKFEDGHRDILLNPAIIVEVLSPSTERYDRGRKFGLYRKLDSLAEYVLISQDKCLVERYIRQPNGQWLLSETDRMEDVVQFPSIQCAIAVTQIYRNVEL